MSPTYRIASIPGDGIGPEVVSATIQVVEKLAQALNTFKIEFTHIPWGTAYYKEHGRYVSEDSLDTLREFDAGLFGAVGAPGTWSYCNSESIECPYLVADDEQMSPITFHSGVFSSPSEGRSNCTPMFDL